MTNTEETEQSKDKQSIWDEAINLCRMRIALKTSAERIRDNVDRRVRWDCAEAVWVWLTTTLQGGGGAVKRKMKKCGKMRKKMRKNAAKKSDDPNRTTCCIACGFSATHLPSDQDLGPRPQTANLSA